MHHITHPTLGNISVVGLGTYWDATDTRGLADTLRAGIDHGANLIDTSELYLRGISEEIISKVITDRENLIISSKVGPAHLAKDDVIAACESSLHRLGTDYLDIYYVHWPNPTIPFGKTFSALLRLKENGKIRSIGLSNFTKRDLQGIDVGNHIDFVQDEFNSFDTSTRERGFPLCKECNARFVAYSPLDKGHVFDNPEIQTIAQEMGIPISQILLQWNLRKTDGIVIPCSKSVPHTIENVRAGDVVLDDTAMKLIDSVLHTDISHVTPEAIKVVEDGELAAKVYTTIDEARENRLNFTPAPTELASDYQSDIATYKPVRLRPSTDPSGKYEYDLIEGRIRYWAWIIAFSQTKKIPALIRGE